MVDFLELCTYSHYGTNWRLDSQSVLAEHQTGQMAHPPLYELHKNTFDRWYGHHGSDRLKHVNMDKERVQRGNCFLHQIFFFNDNFGLRSIRTYI